MKTAPSVRIFRVIVPVSSIDGAAEFYGAILDQAGVRISPGRHYFGCGSVILACFDPRMDGDPWDAEPNPNHLYLAVSDLEILYERIKARSDARIDKEIETQPWGERSFYCRDPYGNKLCFVEEPTLFTADLI